MNNVNDQWEGTPGSYLREANVAGRRGGWTSFLELERIAFDSYWLRRSTVMADRLVPNPRAAR